MPKHPGASEVPKQPVLKHLPNVRDRSYIETLTQTLYSQALKSVNKIRLGRREWWENTVYSFHEMFNLALYRQHLYRLYPYPCHTWTLLLHPEESVICLSAHTFLHIFYFFMFLLLPSLALPWGHTFPCHLIKGWLLSSPRCHTCLDFKK